MPFSSLLDRVVRPLQPRPIESFTPPPRRVTDGVWTIDGPALARIAEWSFERILVSHGEPLEQGARDAFRRVYARWLFG